MEEKKRERTGGKEQNKVLEQARIKAINKESQRKLGKEQDKKEEQLTAIKRCPKQEQTTKDRTKKSKKSLWKLRNTEKNILSPSHFGFFRPLKSGKAFLEF